MLQKTWLVRGTGDPEAPEFFPFAEIDMDDHPALRDVGCIERGWVWLCDEHDSHGTADTWEEACHMAAGHVYWFETEALDTEDDTEPCQCLIWEQGVGKPLSH